MSGGLLQLSGVVVDLVHHIDRMPGAGEEVETSRFAMTTGGGFNAMAAARRMGVSVTYGGMLGTGPLADIAMRDIVAGGITLPPSRRVGIDQGSCAVIVDSTGERSFITHHGAEREVSAAHLQSLQAEHFGFALLTGYSLYKPNSAAAFAAWLARLPRPPLLFFDPGPTVAGIPRGTLDLALARSDWVSANAEEARIMTGVADPCGAAQALSHGRTGAVVRCGADGCWLAAGEEVRHIGGFAVDAVDTNGAGDAHDGVFIAALIMGADAFDAAVIANAAAALSTTEIGPATSPAYTEARRFLADRGATLRTPEFWNRVQPGS